MEMKFKTIKVRCYNIDWDTDGDKKQFDLMPQEVTMELEVPEDANEDELDDYIGGKLSDDYGYCHFGYEYDILPNVGIFTISMQEGKTDCEDCPFARWSTLAQDYIACKSAPFPCDKYNLATMQFQQ